jgi:hypothetical protein
MQFKREMGSSFWLGGLAALFSLAGFAPTANSSEVKTHVLTLQEFQVAHCCHSHPYSPYDSYCCHEPSSTVYVAPAYGVGPASVRGVSRRTARRTSRRVSRRR